MPDSKSAILIKNNSAVLLGTETILNGFLAIIHPEHWHSSILTIRGNLQANRLLNHCLEFFFVGDAFYQT